MHSCSRYLEKIVVQRATSETYDTGFLVTIVNHNHVTTVHSLNTCPDQRLFSNCYCYRVRQFRNNGSQLHTHKKIQIIGFTLPLVAIVF